MGYIEFSDHVKRLRRNIFIISGIALFLVFNVTAVEGDASFFGLRLVGIDANSIRWALAIVIGFEGLSFVWSAWDEAWLWVKKFRTHYENEVRQLYIQDIRPEAGNNQTNQESVNAIIAGTLWDAREWQFVDDSDVIVWTKLKWRAFFPVLSLQISPKMRELASSMGNIGYSNMMSESGRIFNTRIKQFGKSDYWRVLGWEFFVPISLAVAVVGVLLGKGIGC